MSPKKPPRKPKPAKAPALDLALGLRAIIAEARDALAGRMAELRAAEPSPETTNEILTIAKETSTVMNGVRRLDDSIRAASKKLSPSAVIEYLRTLPPEERDQLLTDATGEESRGSVFGR